jgi:hypothetical protein
MRSEQLRLREVLRSELAQEHQAELEAAVSSREKQLRAELGADAERSRSEALARQRKLLEGERDAAKTELANVRADLDGARSRYEEDLARATARATKLEDERVAWREDETRRIEAEMRGSVAEERSRLEAERDAATTALSAVQTQLGQMREEHERHVRELESLREADARRVEAEVRGAVAEDRSRLERERDDARAEQTAMREEARARGAAHQMELTRQREVLMKEMERALAVKDSQATAERESLKREVSDLQRTLERKTANELGEGGEIDLHETLREAFPEDRIIRIKKGQPGADIRHEVMNGGEVCGKILYDSKNHKSWRTDFAEKLKADQIDEGADHAILSTLRFPEGERHIATVCDVIVTGPKHVVHIAQLMRRSVINLHVQGLSLKDRARKQEALYKHITSGPFRQQLAELERLNEKMGEIEIEEERRHQLTWKERGKLIARQKRALGEVAVGVGSIIEGASFDEDA